MGTERPKLTEYERTILDLLLLHERDHPGWGQSPWKIHDPTHTAALNRLVKKGYVDQDAAMYYHPIQEAVDSLGDR